MNSKHYRPASAASPRPIGIALLSLAGIALLLDSKELVDNPNVYSYLLIVAFALIATALRRIDGGFTSLIGLLFLATALFVAPRPIFALLTQDTRVYSLTFGLTVEPERKDLCDVLAFWLVGLSTLFGGYFFRYRRSSIAIEPIQGWTRRYLTTCFIVSSGIVAVLLPILAVNRLTAFAAGGYTALYMGQVQYSFDATRAIDFLCPLLYALAVLLRKRSASRVMMVCIFGYVLAGLLTGRRMDAGSWLFVALWHRSTIQEKPLSVSRLLVVLGAIACTFQLLVGLREGGRGINSGLIQFLVGQGITFLLPALSWQIPAPPLHTIFGSFLPLGGIYHFFGIGSAESSNLGSYVCSQAAPTLFASGFGLGSSAYMEVFYVAARNPLLYALSCGALGSLLRRWEELAARNSVALFFLCASLSSLVSTPRGSLNTISSQCIYLSVFMGMILIVFVCFNVLYASVPEQEHLNATG